MQPKLISHLYASIDTNKSLLLWQTSYKKVEYYFTIYVHTLDMYSIIVHICTSYLHFKSTPCVTTFGQAYDHVTDCAPFIITLLNVIIWISAL